MTTTNTTVFPVKALTPISLSQGPDYNNLTIIQEELNSNAMSIPSTQTTFGHLGLTISAADFLTHDPIGFAAPVNPGLNPFHIRPSTAGAIAETNRQHRILRLLCH